MRAGRLRHRVALQSKSVVRDSFGGETISWNTEDTVWAAVSPLSMREYFAARQGEVDINLSVTIRYRAGVRSDWRVLWDGAGYEIVNIINPDGRHIELQLMCTGPMQPT